jgi:hypothetical protein
VVKSKRLYLCAVCNLYGKFSLCDYMSAVLQLVFPHQTVGLQPNIQNIDLIAFESVLLH